MLQFIETICYEKGSFHNIFLHEERMIRTRLHFFGLQDWLPLEDALAGSRAGSFAGSFGGSFGDSSMGSFVGADLHSVPTGSSSQAHEQKVKCRVTYAEHIEGIEFEPYTPKVIQSLRLVYDDDIDYGYKYKDRSALKALLDKRGEADEILVVKNGLVTDTSYSNVVFLRDGKWYTPEKPLLPGTRRADYLHRKLIFPLDISPEDIGQFEEVRLINAMLSLEEAIPVKTDCIFR